MVGWGAAVYQQICPQLARLGDCQQEEGAAPPAGAPPQQRHLGARPPFGEITAALLIKSVSYLIYYSVPLLYLAPAAFVL